MTAVPSVPFPFVGSDGVARTGQTNPLTGQGSIAVEPVGNASINTNQISIGTTATQIVPARAGRNSVTVVNHGTTDVFLGGPNVTIASGVLLAGTKGASWPVPTSGPLYGIVGTGSATVSFLEAFD